MIQAIVFDLGHTLWDIGTQRGALERAYAEARETLARRLGRQDIPSADELQRAVRDVLVAANETYFTDGLQTEQPPSWRWVGEACDSLGIALEHDLLLEITPALFATEIDSLVCSEGTLDAVQSLAAEGYRIGCVTNTLADTPAIRAMLRLHGFEDLMATVVVSADEGFRKPHPSLFQKAMRELGVAPSESVFVGDSPWHDIGGARAAGMKTVLTTQYVARPYGPDDPQPDAVIAHVRELRAAIAAMAEDE